MKKVEKNIFELEESLSKPKKYHDYDDDENIGIRDRKFIQSVNWWRLFSANKYQKCF